MLLKTLISLTLLGAVVVAPARAQAGRDDRGPVAVGVSISTLGIAPELSLHLSRWFGLRSGFHYLSATFDDEVEDVSYEFRPKWRNLTALADVHPFGNAFRLSGGLVLWNTEAEADGLLTGPVEIGNSTYQPSEVGALLGTADYSRSIAPMFGLGFAGRGRFAVTFDLGVVVTGRPDVSLSVDSPLTGAALAALEADVAAEEAEIRQDIADESLARFYPVISLGFKLRF
ncbi:MAG: hypothetical protein AB7R55_07775 [Gemmatimonadales bacterium]